MKTFLKVALAAGLIGYLIKSGGMDLALIPKSFEYPQNWVFCLLGLSVNILTSTFRYKNILQLAVDGTLNFFSVLRINWIGLMFNTILPGSVTGDVIKLVYAKDLAPEKFSKTFLATSVLIDRILGLVGLLFLLGISSLINYSELAAQSPTLKKLLQFNFLIFFGVCLFFISIWLPSTLQESFKSLAEKLPVVGKHAHKFLTEFWMIGRHRKIMLYNVGLSMLGQSFFILGFWWIIDPFLAGAIPFRYALTFIPLGLCTIAIPITPQGLGLGHMAFKTLFNQFGVSNGDGLFNLYFLSNTFINLFGIFPYVLYKKSPGDLKTASLNSPSVENP